MTINVALKLTENQDIAVSMLKIQFKDRRKPAMWLVDSCIKLGSDAECDIVIEEAEVESIHCEINVEQEEITLNNLSKKKSIFVNEFPITKSHSLKAQDVIRIGISELEIIDPLEELNQTRTPVTANKTVIRPAISAWMLKANSAPLAGQFFQVGNDSTIGREEGADIIVPLSFVSRIHATLTVKQDKLYIEDANSSNGTFVNNDRVKRSELHNNDVVRLDEFSFTVVGPEQKDVPLTAVREEAQKQVSSKSKKQQKRKTDTQKQPALASQKVFLHDISKNSTGKVYEIVSRNNHLSKMLGHHISTSETSVSARHIHLNENDLGWEIVNNGAADGLLINNNMQIRAILQDTDELIVGGTKLKFQSDGEVPKHYFTPKRERSFPTKLVIAVVVLVGAGVWGFVNNWFGI